MNINDLPQGSYKVIQNPTNISQLPAGSYQPVTPAPAAPQPNLLQKLGGDITDTAGAIGQRFNNAVGAEQDSMSGKISAPEAGVRIFGQLVGAGNDVVGGAVKGALQTTNSFTGGLAGQAAKGTVAALAQTPIGAMGINAARQGAQKWEDFQTKYPRAAQDLQAVPEVAQMLANFVGGTAAVKGAEVAAPLIKTAATDATRAAASSLAERSTAKALQKTVDAVTPELKGTKLAQAYKDVVRGGRDLTKGGIVKPQEIGVSAREAGVGKRLFDAGVQLSNKPLKDLGVLKTALKDTEGKLESLLAGKDPEVLYNADKPTLLTTLNKISTQMPEEFRAIKDNGNVFNSVVNFGKKIVAKTDDSVAGIRNARTAFDAQAKIEFPSAFKSGSIDLKTPAGRAIKAVRDSINDHLYETAPQGSEIKRLIGIESDIFRATDAIAPRAAKGEGKSLLTKTAEAAREHPLIAAGAAYEGLKHTILPSLPGL